MAKPALVDSVIPAALQERCGDVSAFERLAEGLASQAYGFRHRDTDYVAPINRLSRGFHKDGFVHRKLAAPALPAPAIVDIGREDFLGLVSREPRIL